MTTTGHISINFPAAITIDALGGDTQTGFNIDAQGTGSFTGLSYTVPAHAKGNVRAKIQVMALTSEDVKKLNTIVMGMLNASAREEVVSQEKISATANISVWSIFGGGASASYERTNAKMQSMGLTKDQVDKVISLMHEMASKMSHVTLDFDIDNSGNDYSVSGDLELYTISGTIKTNKGTTEYRMLADKGSAGHGAAPAEGKVIPLS